ncbi:MAG: hypothetical protein DBP02_15210 [gamma proteobacterium symbiont of Ctena orbiculata]|nr:MAG: hypothetical protein DBP02_15210 [gamma proteobacterium symbiont of Ctena orbiculata]
MQRAVWNKKEQWALLGLSLLARVVYLQSLRWRMDFNTGLVGGPGRRLSYAAIAEDVDFIPDHGSHQPEWKPSKDKLRAVLSELIRAGLIQNMGSSPKDGLIIKCLLADTDQSVQNMNPTGTPHEPHSVNPTDVASNDVASEQMNPMGTPHEPHSMNPTHPVSGINNSVESNGGNNPRARVDNAGRLLTHIPEDFNVTKRHSDYAAMHGLPDPGLHVLVFVNHSKSKGNLSADWDAEFFKWLSREKVYQANTSRRSSKQPTESWHPSHKTGKPEPLGRSDPSIALSTLKSLKRTRH